MCGISPKPGSLKALLSAFCASSFVSIKEFDKRHGVPIETSSVVMREKVGEMKEGQHRKATGSVSCDGSLS